MISYNSLKYNNLIKQISKILEINNVDTTDSEAKIPTEVVDLITSEVQLCIVSADKFLSEKCPKCGKIHLNIFPASYHRNVIFKINNLLIKVKIEVPRVICSNCNSTHAILPDFCIPLKQYSKQAILEVSAIASKTSTQQVADSLNLDGKQVRRLVNLVKVQVNKLNLINHILGCEQMEDSKLYELIKVLPENITQIYFENYNTIFLYENSNRKLYLRYAKLSI